MIVTDLLAVASGSHAKLPLALRLGAQVGALFCAMQFAFADPAVTAADEHGGRLEYVHSLIEESSAARRIAASSNETAKSQRLEARSLHEQALAAHARGEHAAANELLSQATRLMFDAVRIVEHNADAQAKKSRDFEARAESVNALATAFERICQEKKCDLAMRRQVLDTIAEKAAEANALRESGDIDAARRRLDEAYVAIKVAVEHQRSGDTLVRSLSFANKEEEYRYELDRNDTHQMLIRLLLDDAARGKSADLQTYLDLAERRRSEAERQAATGKFDAAIQSLESSTRELVRALRRAGIYIPG